MKFSYYENARATVPSGEITLAELAERIRNPDAAFAARIANMRESGDKSLKMKLPAVTLSGVCNGARKADALANHSGLVQLDFDGKDNPDFEGFVELWRDKLREHPSVALAFVSPSGTGVKLAVRVPAELARHAVSAAHAASVFNERFGVVADASCKDPARLCFLSHDANAFLNSDAVPLVLPDAISPEPLEAGSSRAEEIRAALAVIPSRPEYGEWLRIASAVFDALPKPDALALLQEWSPEEKAGEYEAKYRDRLKEVRVGTLFHIAKRHGFISAGILDGFDDDEDFAPPKGFPYEAFAGPAATYAEAIRQTEPVPPELPYLAALSAVSAIVGRSLVAVNPRKARRKSCANLFVFVSAATGEGKSTAAAPFIAPLQRLEAEVIADWKRDLVRARQRKRQLESTMKPRKGTAKTAGTDALVNLDDLVPESTDAQLMQLEERLSERAPSWITTSPTEEGLKADMTTWGECGVVFSAEAGQFISVAKGRYSDGADIFSALCGLFTGDLVCDSRKGGGGVKLAAPCLSVFLAAQPAIVRELRSERARTVGLANRALWVQPSLCPLPDPDVVIPAVPDETRRGYEVFCREVFEKWGGRNPSAQDEVAIEEAAALYLARCDAEMRRACRDGRADPEDSSRRAELITRFALVLHLMRFGAHAHEHPLPLSTIQDAEKLIVWAASPWERDGLEVQRGADDEAFDTLARRQEMKTGLSADGVKRLLGWHREAGGGRRTEAFLARLMKRGRVRLIPASGVERKPRYALASK